MGIEVSNIGKPAKGQRTVSNIYEIVMNYSLFNTSTQQRTVAIQSTSVTTEDYGLFVKDIYSLEFYMQFICDYNHSSSGSSVTGYEYTADFFNNDETYLQVQNVIDIGCEYRHTVNREKIASISSGQQSLLRTRARRTNPTSFESTGNNCGTSNYAKMIVRVIVDDSNLVGIGSNFSGSIKKLT